jgi:hypothetical protein
VKYALAFTYSSSCLWEIWDFLEEFQGSELVGEENGHLKWKPFPSHLSVDVRDVVLFDAIIIYSHIQ